VNLPNEQEQRRTDAFNAAYEWKGKTFEGVSCSRKDIWVSMCHKSGFPTLDACFDEFSLFAPLSKVLIFVCITPTAQLRKLRAQGIQALIDACDDWIDANIKISEERDAISLGLRILNDSTANQSEVVQTAGAEGKR
jgi:hypothetical protein